jgi:hypothetical protein
VTKCIRLIAEGYKLMGHLTQSRKESKERKENQMHFEKGFKPTSFSVFLGVFPFIFLSVFALRFMLYAFC